MSINMHVPLLLSRITVPSLLLGIVLSVCYSFIPLACAEFDNSLPFSGASSIPLLCTFSCHLPPPSILPPSHTQSCHLFLNLPLILLVPKLVHNTLLGIPFSSMLCTCPNQCNLFNLIVSIIVGFLTLAKISLLVNILQFSFSLSYNGPKILLHTFLSKS